MPSFRCNQCSKLLEGIGWKGKYRTFGKHFGYPKCCIEVFITEVEKKRKVKMENKMKVNSVKNGQKAIKNYTKKRQNMKYKVKYIQEKVGFVPCDKCKMKIANKGENGYDLLLVDRECKLTLEESFFVT